jgi:hypothetical protein
LRGLWCWATPFIPKIELSHTKPQQATPSHNKPQQATTSHMNHPNDTYSFHNNVKFTGRAIESPDDVITTLLYLMLLVMMAMNVWPQLPN